MKLEKEDPRLCQFVLNEISHEDRILVQQAIDNQPEIKQEVESLQLAFQDLKSASLEPEEMKLMSSQTKDLFAKTIYSKKASILFFQDLPSFLRWVLPVGGAVAVAAFAFMNIKTKIEVSSSPVSTMAFKEEQWVDAAKVSSYGSGQAISDFGASIDQAYHVELKEVGAMRESLSQKQASDLLLLMNQCVVDLSRKKREFSIKISILNKTVKISDDTPSLSSTERECIASQLISFNWSQQDDFSFKVLSNPKK